MSTNYPSLFENSSRLFIKQIKEWGEILIGFETKNKYQLLNENGDKIGFIAEQGKGFIRAILRLILRSHRPLDVSIFDTTGKEVIKLERPFYCLFSDMNVTDSTGRKLGSIHQQFSFIRKKYQLKNSSGSTFASIDSGFFSFFSFEINSTHGNKLGHIKKKWGGALKEIFTDSDTFGVDISNDLTDEQKALVLATAISIDFDYFEDNSSKSNAFNVLD